MKTQLGVLSNMNLLAVSFGLTHRDLAVAKTLDSQPLIIKDEDGNALFSVLDSSCTSANDNGVTFPFKGAKTKSPVIGFTIVGEDQELVKFNAARTVANLELIEKQVKAAMKAVKAAADSIKEMVFE